MAIGGGVSEAGMHVSGLHRDPVKPSVLQATVMVWAAQQGLWPFPAETVVVVAWGGSLARWDQGGGRGRSSDDAQGNLGGAKGLWSTEDGAEKACESLSEGRTGMARPRLVLYGRPPTTGEGVLTPLLCRSSVTGDVLP